MNFGRGIVSGGGVRDQDSIVMVACFFGQILPNANHQKVDVLGSIPALVGSTVLLFFRDLIILDHIGAIIVAGMILYLAWEIVSPALRDLSEVGVSKKNRKTILQLINSVERVHVVRNLRSRKSGSHYFLDVSILVKGDSSIMAGHDVAEKAVQLLKEKIPDIVDVVVHVEPFSEEAFIRDVNCKMAGAGRQR